MQITQLHDDRRPLMVASHERSGTHFTMNTLAACFGYVGAPWLDLDRYEFNINFFRPQTLGGTLMKLAMLRPANLGKTHYDFEFFAPFVGQLGQMWDVVYIYRHPADVMASYWRFLHTWDWDEGPKAPSVSAFANAEPMGQLMRLQYRQRPTMLDRWAAQVEGWTAAAAANPAIRLVRYEDLADRYATTIRELGEALGRPAQAIVRPPRGRDVVQAGTVSFAPPPGADDRETVTELAWRKHPALMARLGYDRAWPARAAGAVGG